MLQKKSRHGTWQTREFWLSSHYLLYAKVGANRGAAVDEGKPDAAIDLRRVTSQLPAGDDSTPASARSARQLKLVLRDGEISARIEAPAGGKPDQIELIENMV